MSVKEVANMRKELESMQLLLQAKKTPVATSSGGLLESKQLEGQNYSDWKFLMKYFLIDAGLWNCVEGTDVDSELDRRALAKINLSGKPMAASITRNAKTVKEAWESLSNMYENKGAVRRI